MREEGCTLMWLRRFCLWTLPFMAPCLAAAGSALAQESAPAGAHVEGVAAEGYYHIAEHRRYLVAEA